MKYWTKDIQSRTARGEKRPGCGYEHEYELLKWYWEERFKFIEVTELWGYAVGWALYVDLNGYVDHLHYYYILRKHSQKNLDHHDADPKWLISNKQVRA